MNQALYSAYVKILEEELVPAMGCTEPIAVAYAAALARKALGEMPQSVEVHVSANIIKNVKSVVVPHTGGLRGIGAAVAAGIVAGDADRELEVLSAVTEEQVEAMAAYLKDTPISIAASDNGYIFDIQIRANAGEHTAFVQIAGSHTNVIRVEKDGVVLRSLEYTEGGQAEKTDRSLLNVEQIIEFADCVDIEDVKAVLDRQIDFNTTIAEEGLSGKWGANIGRVLLNAYGNDVANRAKATAAAGSDARMSGCEKPVVINSGSGNQGMTASLPVIVYAKELNTTREQLYRALVVSNLVTIHLKTGIGRLSAYCGATSAVCGAGPRTADRPSTSTSRGVGQSPWRTETRSPARTSREGLASWPLTRTRPRSISSAASERVLKKRAAQSHLSRRWPAGLPAAGAGEEDRADRLIVSGRRLGKSNSGG